MYDIQILGAGPAGLSAAVAERQKNKSVLLFTNASRVNPFNRSACVDNYLGQPQCTGAEMLERFLSHALDMGAQLRVGRAVSAMTMGDCVYLTVGSELFEGKRLILASGVVRQNGYDGEHALLGAGVSYCATCDGMLYRNRPVAVIGNSADAPLEANYLQSIGCQVVYVSAKQPQGLHSDIPFVRASRISVRGEARVTGVLADGAVIPCEGVFIVRQAVAPTQLLPQLHTENGAIVVDRFMRTSVPLVFAAGDCTGKPFQVAKAVGEGLIAADTAADELTHKL